LRDRFACGFDRLYLRRGPGHVPQRPGLEKKDSAQAIGIAQDDAQRAKAYSSRCAAYSEKARYSRLLKLISNDEYERLFDLAMKDHNQAVAPNPNDAEGYFNRRQTYYDRGGLDLIYIPNPFEAKPRNNTWLHAAALDTAMRAHNWPVKQLVFRRALRHAPKDH
jgi:hypothetical protein